TPALLAGPRPATADGVAAVYTPRSPTTGVLYGVVRSHLAELLAAVDAETDGSGLPGFVRAPPLLTATPSAGALTTEGEGADALRHLLLAGVVYRDRVDEQAAAAPARLQRDDDADDQSLARPAARRDRRLLDGAPRPEGAEEHPP